MAEWKARTELTPSEYEFLLKWIYDNYGSTYPVPPNTADIFDTWQYQYWQEAGKPGLREKLKRGIAQPTPEEKEMRFQQWATPPPTEEPMPEWPIEPMTEYQRAQWELQQQSAERDWQYRQWQMRPQGEQVEDPRIRELEFDLWKQQQLAGLTGPADWIKRWQMMNAPGPVRRRVGTPAEQGQYTHTTTPTAGAGFGGGEPAWQTTAQWQPAPAGKRKITIEEDGGGQQTPSAPQAPGWLPQFAPSQVAGQPITQGSVVTPSGQQWAQTPWSVREGLRGFTQFAGQRPLRDIMDQMAMMQPGEPPKPRGWRPFRQRA